MLKEERTMKWLSLKVLFIFFIVIQAVIIITRQTGNDFHQRTHMRKKMRRNNTYFNYVNCSQQLDHCLQHITNVTTNSKLSFPETFSELRYACRILERGDYCIQQYVHECMTPTAIRMIWDMMHGTKNVLRLLCHNLTIQNDYLRYAPCFKRMVMIHCSHILQRFNSISNGNFYQQHLEEHSSTSELKKFCCIYKSSIECQLNSIRNECTNDSDRDHNNFGAMAFFLQYSNEMSDSILMQHCFTYTYSNQCIQSEEIIVNNRMNGIESLNTLPILLLLTSIVSYLK